jgi:hypothetical protein
MNRKTIYLTPEAVRKIDERATGNQDTSRAVCRMIERYAKVSRWYGADFSSDEWEIIRQACKGWEPDADSLHAIAFRVAAYTKAQKLDRSTLIERLHELDYAECLGVIDNVERYWAKER